MAEDVRKESNSPVAGKTTKDTPEEASNSEKQLPNKATRKGEPSKGGTEVYVLGVEFKDNAPSLPPQLGGKSVLKEEAQVFAAEYRSQAKALARNSDVGPMLTALGTGLSVLFALLAATSSQDDLTTVVPFGGLAAILLIAFLVFQRRANQDHKQADVLEEVATLWDHSWLSNNDAAEPNPRA